MAKTVKMFCVKSEQLVCILSVSLCYKKILENDQMDKWKLSCCESRNCIWISHPWRMNKECLSNYWRILRIDLICIFLFLKDLPFCLNKIYEMRPKQEIKKISSDKLFTSCQNCVVYKIAEVSTKWSFVYISGVYRWWSQSGDRVTNTGPDS